MLGTQSSSLFLPKLLGSSTVLILCCSIFQTSASIDNNSTSNQESITSEGLFNNSKNVLHESGRPQDGNYNTSLFDVEESFNVTEHRGFLHGFVEALSVIVVSELGDKTFFIAAILAMRNNKLTVFLAAISALAVMTVLSALLGFVVTTFIPREYTYYTCTAIMFLFGLKMLYEAWKMKPNEGEETQREVEEELARRGSSPSVNDMGTEEISERRNEEDEEESKRLQGIQTERIEHTSDPSLESKQGVRTWGKQIREKSWFGKKCVKIFRVFSNTFAMTFLAEWGDRSQLATIVLAGINDVGGVCVGGVLGHFICTGLAVICGALIAKKISVRMVTLIGALVFIGFAVASLFIDPYEENHLVPDVEGDDHNSTIFIQNNIEFVESSTFASKSLFS